jgi:hypothetical protein
MIEISLTDQDLEALKLTLDEVIAIIEGDDQKALNKIIDYIAAGKEGDEDRPGRV